MEINERLISQIVVTVCNSVSGAMVFIGVDQRRYTLIFWGFLVAFLMVVGVAEGQSSECYGQYNEKCLCEYNKRTKGLYITCPTRPKSNFGGRDVSMRLKKKSQADKGLSLLRLNDSLLVVRGRR